MGQRGRWWGRCRGRSCRCPRAGRRRGTTTGRCTTSTTAAAPPAGSTPATGGRRRRRGRGARRAGRGAPLRVPLLAFPGGGTDPRAAGVPAAARRGSSARPLLAPKLPGRYLLPAGRAPVWLRGRAGRGRVGTVASLPAAPAGRWAPACRSGGEGWREVGGCFVLSLRPAASPVSRHLADPRCPLPAGRGCRAGGTGAASRPAAGVGSPPASPHEQRRLGGAGGAGGAGSGGRRWVLSCVAARLCGQRCGLGERGEHGGRGLRGVFPIAPVCLPLPSGLLSLLLAPRSSFPGLLALKSKSNREESTVRAPSDFSKQRCVLARSSSVLEAAMVSRRTGARACGRLDYFC